MLFRAARRPATVPLRFIRTYADSGKPAPRKKAPMTDISQIPIKSIGVLADFYIPPRFTASPLLKWHRLLFRRLGLFAVNTYSIVKFRRETGLRLQFNNWKETAVEHFVRTNKVFAAACSSLKPKREAYLRQQLEGVCGSEVVKSMVARAASFPAGTKLEWELVAIDGNPKVVSFNTLPDSSNLAAYVQLIVQVLSRQKLTLSGNMDTTSTERAMTDYLVYTLNPFTNEMVLVGNLFESDANRGVQPEINFNNAQAMLAFQAQSADIFRAPPAKNV